MEAQFAVAQAGENPVTVNLHGAAQDFRNAFYCLGIRLPEETPYRIAKAWAEMLAGYREDWRQYCKRFKLDDIDQFDGDEPFFIPLDFSQTNHQVEIRCSFVSICEHHVLPFEGEAVVRYGISDGHVLGASKVVRIVQSLARRLQLQERLTAEIAQAIAEAVNPMWVEVETVATHACIRCRGVRDSSAEMRCVATWQRHQEDTL
jgi:GTP cyclohydrolase I